MHLLASSILGRAVLHGAVSALRPLLLGISERTVRPIYILLARPLVP